MWEHSVEPLVNQLKSWFPDRLPTLPVETTLKLVEQTAPTPAERIPSFERFPREAAPKQRDEISEIRPLQIAAAGSAHMHNLRN
jgi:hypothetical protein